MANIDDFDDYFDPAQVLPNEQILRAYALGYFPMTLEQGQDISWIKPKRRGVLPLNGLHISRSLSRTLRKGTYTIKVDTAFADVMEGCANRPETWISPEIRQMFLNLHEAGHAHSIECWKGDNLVGGLYGLAIRGMFAGESMFSYAANASKIALVALVDILNNNGFVLLDTQFVTPHLESLGAMEVSGEVFDEQLKQALRIEAKWPTTPSK